MATFYIQYLPGDSETVQADDIIRHDDDFRAYRIIDGRDTTVALIPASNVLSIVRTDDPTAGQAAG